MGSHDLQAMNMKLEPQSLSRGSKPKLLSDASRKNLNDSGNLGSGTDAPYGDQNLMNELNNVYFGQNNTGLLSDSLKIPNSEGRLKTGTPPHASAKI